MANVLAFVSGDRVYTFDASTGAFLGRTAAAYSAHAPMAYAPAGKVLYAQKAAPNYDPVAIDAVTLSEVVANFAPSFPLASGMYSIPIHGIGVFTAGGTEKIILSAFDPTYGDYKLFAFNLATGAPVTSPALPSIVGVGDVVVSRDGSRVLIADYMNTKIYAASDFSLVATLSPAPGGVGYDNNWARMPVFSPDGSRVSFALKPNAGDWKIYTCNAATGAAISTATITLADGAYSNYAGMGTAFAPDNVTLFVSIPCTGQDRVYLVNTTTGTVSVSGTATRDSSEVGVGDGSIANKAIYSPDGTKIFSGRNVLNATTLAPVSFYLSSAPTEMASPVIYNAVTPSFWTNFRQSFETIA